MSTPWAEPPPGARRRVKDPNLARSFVFSTGDTASVDIEDALRNVPLLEKPFTTADLNAVLERVGIPAAVAGGI